MFSKTLLLASSLLVALSTATPEVNLSEHATVISKETTSELSARALGQAIIANRCDFPLYLWSVDFDHGNPAMITIPARTRHIEPFRSPSNGGGVSLKVSKTTRNDQHAITQFEYTVAGNQIWYDVSFVDCAKGNNADNCPGHALGLRANCNDGKCPEVACKSNEYCPFQIYYDPDGPDGAYEPTKSSGAGHTSMQLNFIVCDSKPALKKRSVAGRLMIEGEDEA